MGAQTQVQKKGGGLAKKRKVLEDKVDWLLHKYEYIDVHIKLTAGEKKGLVDKAAKSSSPFSALNWELKKLIMSKDPASAIKIDIAEYREKGKDIPSKVELEAVKKAELIGGFKGYRIALEYLQGKDYGVGPEVKKGKKAGKIEPKEAEDEAEITTVLDDLKELKELNAYVYKSAVWLADYGLAAEEAMNLLKGKKDRTPEETAKMEQMEADLEGVKADLEEARSERDLLLKKLGLAHLYEFEITPGGKMKQAPLAEEIQSQEKLETYTAIAGNARYMDEQLSMIIDEVGKEAKAEKKEASA